MRGQRTGDVWAHAEVNERAAAVGGGAAAVRDLVADDGHLEGVVRKQLQSLAGVDQGHMCVCDVDARK